MHSPASILDTSLAGMGGSPAPMVTQSSGAGRGGVVTESDRPKVLTPRTEPTGGRLPSAMGKNRNTEEVYIYNTIWHQWLWVSACSDMYGYRTIAS